MAQVLVTESYLQDIADAIRSKNGTQNTYTPAQMADAVSAISGGGGTPRTSSDLTVSGATVTAPAGTYAADASKSVASGSVTSPSTISATGASVTTGTNTLTLSKTVSVTPTVSTAGYVSSGTAGDSSVSLTASVNTRNSSDLNASGDTVSVPAGYYAEAVSKAVSSGTEGTPTATKGTVSNHAISVTPSVTNTAGYISGSTKTGTAVSVSASEVVSGTLTISSSGTKDVTNYASASVASGSATTPATTVTVTPSISVASSTGVITASVSGTKSVTPTVNAGYVSSGTSGTITVSGSNTSNLTVQAAQTIHPSSTDQTITSGKYLTGTQTIKAVSTTNLTAENIKSGVVVKIGDSTDDDCVASVTGSYTGSGGSSMNFQVSNSQVRLANKTALSDTGLTLTVNVTGKYNVYWSAFRTNTSSNYTWGSQLYIGTSAYGSENTSWSNSYNQVNKLTNVSLTKDQVLHVYGRTRSGTSYYICCSNLIIEQTS